MKEFKHTEGEWEVFDLGKMLGVTTSQADVAWCNDEGRSFHSIRPRVEDVANAYLMAAAPQMLKALQSIKSDGFGNTTADWSLIDAAILKSKVPCPSCEWKIGHHVNCVEAEKS